MAQFTYKAFDKSGKIVEGQLDGTGEKEIIAKLKLLNLSPVNLSEKKVSGQSKAGLKRKKITKRDVLHMTNQLASLLSAKLPLSKALQTIQNQASSFELKEMMGTISESVKEGKTLSEALSMFPRYFSGLYRSMVSAGEVGGMMNESLAMVAETLEKDEALKSKLKGALTYPAVMMIVMLASVIVLITFVVPKFTGVFAEMGGSLPLPTKILVAVSDVFQKWWPVMVITITSISFAVRKYINTKRGEYLFDKLKLNLPLAGGLVRDVTLSRFSLTLGTLIENGVSMIDAMDATKDVAGNAFIYEVLEDIQKEVKEGKALSQALNERGDIFPPLMTGMVGTGEETGNLSEMLVNAGKYFMQESDQKIETLTSLLEPLIIVVMGLMVGVIIMGMLLPIFDMSTAIK